MTAHELAGRDPEGRPPPGGSTGGIPASDLDRRDGIRYFADPLPGNRAQLHADVVLDGKLELSYPVGSPAPAATVAEYAQRLGNGPWRRGHR